MFQTVCQGRSEQANICTETWSVMTGVPKPTMYMEGRRVSYLCLPSIQQDLRQKMLFKCILNKGISQWTNSLSKLECELWQGSGPGEPGSAQAKETHCLQAWGQHSRAAWGSVQECSAPVSGFHQKAGRQGLQQEVKTCYQPGLSQKAEQVVHWNSGISSTQWICKFATTVSGWRQ